MSRLTGALVVLIIFGIVISSLVMIFGLLLMIYVYFFKCKTNQSTRTVDSVTADVTTPYTSAVADENQLLSANHNNDIVEDGQVIFTEDTVLPLSDESIPIAESSQVYTTENSAPSVGIPIAYIQGTIGESDNNDRSTFTHSVSRLFMSYAMMSASKSTPLTTVFNRTP